MDRIRNIIRKGLAEHFNNEGSRQKLSEVEKVAMNFFKKSGVVRQSYGIGSYFTTNKANPDDLDFVLKLNIPFESDDAHKFSDALEELKGRFLNEEGETLINVFLIDSNDRRLNSVDLWFIGHRGEKLEDVLNWRERIVRWDKIRKLK